MGIRLRISRLVEPPASSGAPDPRCILCKGSTTTIRRWMQQDIRKAYGSMAGKPLPETISTADYRILECSNCGLVFAEPQTPGDQAFYEWVSQGTNYYPVHRWEWERVLDVLSISQAKNILEVGCGTGNFLQYVLERLHLDATGLDTNPSSIQQAKERGLNVRCQSLETYISENPSSRFDVLCAYHCLEHVADPKAFLGLMQRVLIPDGLIVVSVPYSPTSWEALEWACLNLPPHHLTRWNKTSLECLASEVGMSAEIETEPSDLRGALPIKPLVWQFLALTGGAYGGLMDYVRPIIHPVRFARWVGFVLSRDRTSSGLAGDTAFVKFRFGDHHRRWKPV